jgi:hypothetical protein
MKIDFHFLAIFIEAKFSSHAGFSIFVFFDTRVNIFIPCKYENILGQSIPDKLQRQGTGSKSTADAGFLTLRRHRLVSRVDKAIIFEGLKSIFWGQLRVYIHKKPHL